jgi:hypothetical protein
MSVVRVERSALIRANARVAYRLIADYREGHPRIVPKQYFPRLEVERGGVGAGTIVRFQLRAFGATREVRAEITEPKPGEVLVETDLATGAKTTFIVTAVGEGQACRVTIRTEWEAKGFRGWVERMTAPRLLQRIYAEELAKLAAVVDEESGAESRGTA